MKESRRGQRGRTNPRQTETRAPRRQSWAQAASAAGAAIGAIVGDRLSKRNQGPYREREVTRCEMIDQWETRLTGYHVVYRYRGHTQDTMLPYDPGRKLALRVAIEPLDADHQEDDAWNR